MTVTTIVGSYLSPYVRKVLVCLELKGIAYRVDPIVPFYGNDEFGRISPTRRVPVLIDDTVTLCDSTVICEYLEDRYPQPALLPGTPQDRARARWLEEFADSRMGEVFVWHFYNQIVIKRAVWGETADEEVLRKAREVEIPQILDYLEREVPAEGFLFDTISIADIAIATFFRNAAYVRFAVDAQRWPKTATYVSRILGQPPFTKLQAFEALLMRTPITEHRSVLAAAGAPLSDATLMTTTPRRSMFTH